MPNSQTLSTGIDPFDTYESIYERVTGRKWPRLEIGAPGSLLVDAVRFYDSPHWDASSWGSPPKSLPDAVRWAFWNPTEGSIRDERYAFVVATLHGATRDGTVIERQPAIPHPSRRDMQRLWAGVRTTHRSFPLAHQRAKSLAPLFIHDVDPERVSRTEWFDAFAWRLLDLGYAIAKAATGASSPTNRDLLAPLAHLDDDDLLFAWTGAYAPAGILPEETDGVRALGTALVAWWAARSQLEASAVGREYPPHEGVVAVIADGIEGEGGEHSERAWLAAASIAANVGRG